MKNARLIIAIITNLLDEAVIVAAIIFGLPRLGINIPVWGIALICVLFLIYAVAFYQIGSKIIKKKPMPGFSDMVGIKGKVTAPLNPVGLVKIEGELWEARAESGTIEAGTEVIVISQSGLRLIVRPQLHDMNEPLDTTESKDSLTSR